MDTTKQFKIFFIGAAILFFGAFYFFNSNAITFAQNENSSDEKIDNIGIRYPINELGGCKNKSDCKTFCDKPNNIEACIDFAEKRNLMQKEEIDAAKKFVAAGKKGPGGCTTKESCENYCDNLKNIDECLAFAEKSGIMNQKEFSEAKKVKAAMEKGAKLPGGCSNKKDCDTFCSNPDNIEECVNFAETAGFMPEEELKEARKVVEVIKTKGIKPPPCRGKQDCDDYCGAPEHFEECIAFAEAAGFMKPEEVQMARKTGGKGPGGCKGREECDSFCQQESNFETCLSFAKEHGLMSEKDAEMARKTGGKGPGGCKGEKECREFCDNPNNQEICFNFAKEHDLMPPEELQKMEEGRQKMKRSFMNMPPEIAQCLNSSLGENFVDKLKEGLVLPNPKIGEQMRSCFEKMGPPKDMMPGGEIMPQGDMQGIPRPEGETFSGTILPQNTPPEIAECLKSELGENISEQMRSEALQPGKDINEKVKACFEKFGTSMQEMPPENIIQRKGSVLREEMMSPQNIPQQIQCRTKEECENICRSNPEKCPGFKPEGMMPPEAFQKPPENIIPLREQMQPEHQQQYQQLYPIQTSPEFYKQEIQQPPEFYQQQLPLPPTDYQLLPLETTTPPTSYNYPPTILKLAANILIFLLK